LIDGKNKELKGVEKPLFDKVQRQVRVGGGGMVGTFLFDTLAQFLTGQASATMRTAEAQLRSFESFQAAIRKVQHLALDKAVIEGVMKRITGEAQGAKGADGDIYAALVAQDAVERHIDYFPFFRLLSKMAHLSMASKREVSAARKIQAIDEKIAKIRLDMETQRILAQNLNFHEDLHAEAERIRHSEISQLTEKREKVNQRLFEVQREMDNFVENYFEGLPH